MEEWIERCILKRHEGYDLIYRIIHAYHTDADAGRKFLDCALQTTMEKTADIELYSKITAEQGSSKNEEWMRLASRNPNLHPEVQHGSLSHLDPTVQQALMSGQANEWSLHRVSKHILQSVALMAKMLFAKEKYREAISITRHVTRLLAPEVRSSDRTILAQVLTECGMRADHEELAHPSSQTLELLACDKYFRIIGNVHFAASWLVGEYLVWDGGRTTLMDAAEMPSISADELDLIFFFKLLEERVSLLRQLNESSSCGTPMIAQTYCIEIKTDAYRCILDLLEKSQFREALSQLSAISPLICMDQHVGKSFPRLYSGLVDQVLYRTLLLFERVSVSDLALLLGLSSGCTAQKIKIGIWHGRITSHVLENGLMVRIAPHENKPDIALALQAAREDSARGNVSLIASEASNKQYVHSSTLGHAVSDDFASLSLDFYPFVKAQNPEVLKRVLTERNTNSTQLNTWVGTENDMFHFQGHADPIGRAFGGTSESTLCKAQTLAPSLQAYPGTLRETLQSTLPFDHGRLESVLRLQTSSQDASVYEDLVSMPLAARTLAALDICVQALFQTPMNSSHRDGPSIWDTFLSHLSAQEFLLYLALRDHPGGLEKISVTELRSVFENCVESVRNTLQHADVLQPLSKI